MVRVFRYTIMVLPIVLVIIISLSCSKDKGTEPTPPPAAPTLSDPGSVDSDGSYSVTWSSPSGATKYTLQEDDNSSFSSPQTAYSGSSTQKSFSGKPNGTYYYRVNCENSNGTSGWSNTESITVSIPESITTPNTPSGPANGEVGQNLTYSTGGSSSNLGHSVQYQFDWGDGSGYSSWSNSTSASHSYANPGTYYIDAHARCATHTSVTSNWSNSKRVDIVSNVHEVNYPNGPSGPENGYVDSTYTYTTGGSSCTKGHPVQYRFVWGTGDTSPWSNSNSASHSWSRTGAFYLGAQARCAVDTTVVSDWSLSMLVVHIEEPVCAINVTSPAYQDFWVKGSTHNITWSSTAGGPNVKIELYWSGSYWCTIASSTPNDGSYSWAVDDCGGGYYTNYRIVVTDLSDNECTDGSNFFTISPSSCNLSITSPSGGATWNEGESRSINWTSSGSCGSNVSLALYKGSSSLCTISSSTANDGSYSWNVDDCGGGSGSDYRIRVTSLSSGDYDYSGYFTINAQQPCVLNITYPTSSTTWGVGDNAPVNWTKSGSCGSEVKIELYQGSSKVCNIVSNTPNDGEYRWHAVGACCGNLANKFRFKITDLSTYEYDYSDEFTISGSDDCITGVAFPNQYTLWTIGDTEQITFSMHDGSPVDIDLYFNGSYLCNIARSAPYQVYTWTVTDCGLGYDLGTLYQIKITSTCNSSCYSFSEMFRIQK